MDSLYLLAVDSTFNFCASYKVVDSESFNLYFLGFWASEFKGALTCKPHQGVWLWAVLGFLALRGAVLAWLGPSRLGLSKV